MVNFLLKKILIQFYNFFYKKLIYLNYVNVFFFFFRIQENCIIGINFISLVIIDNDLVYKVIFGLLVLLDSQFRFEFILSNDCNYIKIVINFLVRVIK